MTEQEIAALGPAFAAELRRYRDGFGQDRTAAHFDTSCRRLLSDLPRQSVQPIARAAGTAARAPQEFLVTAAWDHIAARDRLQRRLADPVAERPPDPLGAAGVIDVTTAAEKGDQTPGVHRQDPGCEGEMDNGIVTVPVGVTMGRFQALLEADLYLPQSWAADRDRCREAGIPDDVRHRSKRTRCAAGCSAGDAGRPTCRTSAGSSGTTSGGTSRRRGPTRNGRIGA
jgi:SRSO17 transposase